MSKYLISLILLSVISMGVSAQRITRQYNNVSFSAALKDLNARQDKYVINFVGCPVRCTIFSSLS